MASGLAQAALVGPAVTRPTEGSLAGSPDSVLSDQALQLSDDHSPAEAAWNRVLLGMPDDPAPSPSTRAPWHPGDWESQVSDPSAAPRPPGELKSAAAPINQAQMVDVPVGALANAAAAEPPGEVRELTKISAIKLEPAINDDLSTMALVLAVLVVATSGGLFYLFRRSAAAPATGRRRRRRRSSNKSSSASSRGSSTGASASTRGTSS